MKFKSTDERNGFIENNLKLVTSRCLAINKGVYDDDLFQTGALALIIAIDKFDESREVPFASFAIKYIDGYMLNYINYDSLIKPIRVKGSKEHYSRKRIHSIDEKIDDTELTYAETICGYDSLEDDIVSDIVVAGFLQSLHSRDKKVINYFIDNMKTEQVSKILGISYRHINRILKMVGDVYKGYYFT